MKALKPVAAYLRKSRDEENDPDVLRNHRQMLIELCEREGYEPTFYEEIGSSEKIAYRTEFPRLLEDVATGKYYAVIARDTDRLSRGNALTNPDITTIYNTLIESNTMIHTVIDGMLDPSKDNLFLSIKTLFANMEYEAITKRLYDGKVQGAKRGRWTNGKPPYPYYYNKETKEVLVDREKLPHYRFIIESYLSGKSIQDIAVELNVRGIPSPGGKKWNTTNVHRMLKEEVHLGYVILGKTTGSGHKWREDSSVENRPRNEWIIAEGEHEPVKTQEEHEKIKALLVQNRRVPLVARAGIYPLSGLMYCGICGRRMNFSGKTNQKYLYCRCVYMDWSTNPPTRCPQKAIRINDNDFFDEMFKLIVESYITVSTKNASQRKQHDDIFARLAGIDSNLKKIETTMERLQVQYEEGMIDIATWRERNSAREEEAKKLVGQKEELQLITKYDQPLDAETLEKRMLEIKDEWHKYTTPRQQNNALKEVVDKIIYNYVDKEMQFEVFFR